MFGVANSFWLDKKFWRLFVDQKYKKLVVSLQLKIQISLLDNETLLKTLYWRLLHGSSSLSLLGHEILYVTDPPEDPLLEASPWEFQSVSS